MGITDVIQKKPPGQVSAGRLAAVNDWASRHFSVRADVKVLAPDEQREVVELFEKARTAEGGGFDQSALSKGELARLDALVERAASLPAGHFAAQRKQARASAQIAQIARKALRRPPTPQAEDRLLAELHEQMQAGCLHLRHVGVLTYMLACLSQGEVLAAGASVFRDEGGEPVLRFNAQRGLFGRAAGEEPLNMEILAHLQANSWIKTTRSGPQVELRLGVRGRRALAGVSK